MAHFAKLDVNNNVIAVHVVNNAELLDESGTEQEQLGIQFLIAWSGGHPYWKQTSYSGSFRKNFASPGFVYDSRRDAFIAPKPFDSWILNEQTCVWEAPVPVPQDGKFYVWNEQTKTWVEAAL